MGSGKSTAGKKLAKKLGLKFMDMDEVIEREQGMSVPEIFERFGEDEFRNLERALLHEIIQQDDLVISTGGGVPCFYNNMDLINKNGISIYLKMHPADLADRLDKIKADRPLLKNKSGSQLIRYIKQKLKEREKYYLKARFIVDGLDVKEEKLLEIIKS